MSSNRAERLRRLEGRTATPHKQTPESEMASRIWLKAVNAERRELDGLEPDPDLEPTPEEEAFDKAGLPDWIAYLEGELSRAPPGSDLHDALPVWIEEAKAEMAEETDQEQQGGNG